MYIEYLEKSDKEGVLLLGYISMMPLLQYEEYRKRIQERRTPLLVKQIEKVKMDSQWRSKAATRSRMNQKEHSGLGRYIDYYA